MEQNIVNKLGFAMADELFNQIQDTILLRILAHHLGFNGGRGLAMTMRSLNLTVNPDRLPNTSMKRAHAEAGPSHSPYKRQHEH